MLPIQDLDETEAWQKARQLVMEVYRASGEPAFFNDLPLRGQVRKTAVAILSHLSEGLQKAGGEECDNLLQKVQKLTGELRTTLYTALERGHIGSMTFDRLFELATSAERGVDSLRNWILKSGG